MTRPRLLDLFCGAGGAAVGYHRAGFDVVGVDIKPQPRYPFAFREGDALAALKRALSYKRDGRRAMDYDLDDFAAIHASPPCQAFSSITRINGRRDYPDLVAPTRDLLERTCLPYVIENVVGSPLQDPTLLCGSMFEPDQCVFSLRRHRLFETNWPLEPPTWPCRHKLQGRVFRGADQRSRRKNQLVSVVPVYGSTRFRGDDDLRRQVMGIDWMTRKELTQAIPPLFTEFIGAQLLEHLTLCVPTAAANSHSTPEASE